MIDVNMRASPFHLCGDVTVHSAMRVYTVQYQRSIEEWMDEWMDRSLLNLMIIILTVVFFIVAVC